MAELTRPQPYKGGRVILISMAIGVLGLVLTLVGFAVSPTRTLYAYLTAFSFVASISVGALIFIMIGHLTGGRWFVVVRQVAHAVAAALPLVALLFIPIWVGAGELYPWVDPGPEMDEHKRELIEHKHAYLNVPAFVIRTLVYFVLWIAVAMLTARWAHPAPGAAPEKPTRARILSAAAMPFVGLALTFAAFDWLMSLQPTWYSAIYGVYYFAGGFMATLALFAVLLTLSERHGYLTGLITGSHYHALGRLMFAFVVFWAYVAFFQLFLIYIANRPSEVTFYLERLEHGWDYVFLALILGHFVIPFAVLLSRPMKFRRPVMLAMGAWLVLMHYLDLYWLVIPVAPEADRLHWSDLTALLGVAGLCVAYCAWRIRGHALVDIDDPNIERAVAYRSS